jgi:hypothetical protein
MAAISAGNARHKSLHQPTRVAFGASGRAPRALESVDDAQWRFHCTVHNLLKLHRNGGLALIPTG